MLRCSLLVVALSVASLFTLSGPSHARVAEGATASSSREASRERPAREAPSREASRERSAREAPTREASRERTAREAPAKEVSRERPSREVAASKGAKEAPARSAPAKEVSVKELAPKMDHSKTDFQRAAENARPVVERQQAEKDRAEMRDKTHEGLLRANVGDRVSVGPGYRDGTPEVNVRVSTDPPAKPKK